MKVKFLFILNNLSICPVKYVIDLNSLSIQTLTCAFTSGSTFQLYPQLEKLMTQHETPQSFIIESLSYRGDFVLSAALFIV